MHATPNPAPFDAGRAEAFGEKLLAVMNGGALTLMTSIGHRTGLFDVMRRRSPSTSLEIAAAAGLDERYVREWLGAMAAGGFVESDAAGTLFVLPEEHAVSLTREAGADNVAVFAQYIPILGAVEDRILECFRNGGGVPYSGFPRFHEVMAEDSGQSVLPALIDGILPLAPGVTEALAAGIDVLDIGCGRGRALNLMAATFPASRFTGLDLSAEAVTFARDEAARSGLSNVSFEAVDLTGFDRADAFDFITAFDAIHDQKAPDLVLKAVARALRPGGTFLMQDIAASSHVHKNLDHPLGALLYTVSCLHCMTVSLAQGGAGLGAMWGREKAGVLLRQAGFNDIAVHRLPHDIQNEYTVARVV